MTDAVDALNASGVHTDGLDWLTPSPRLLALRRLEIRVLALVFLAAAIVLAMFFTVAGAITITVVVLGYGWMEWLVVRRFRAWAYAERAEDLLVRRGVMVQRLSVVPYGRMQFVDVVAGPLERRWGLATVRLHTAAAASDARVPGLPTAEAERLRDRLAMLGESRAAGL